eukprot:TRINITY_DN110547_c0_g1_i1.p2 TRINITY_DN110547_c0_g1~~TRINITY_DN110547_c0_g1_i1.p2  ORF type:complete len:324 (-),score=105.54 TRINITY_DN110547_c0_g1_i1:175-1146(-)
MPISEDAAEELEALEAIFGAECFERQGEASLRLRIAPEPDDEGFRCAVAHLDVGLPEGYPASAAPTLAITLPDDSSAGLAEGAAGTLLSVAKAAAEESLGSVALFAISDAVRDWLREHGRLQPEPSAEATEATKATEATEEDDDDFDVDSEDLDDELIEALEELLEKDTARLKELRRIRRLGPGAEQRQKLRAQLRALTPAEREALVGSDSESENEAPQKGAAAKKAEPVVKLAPAQMECPSGHELAAFSARPSDYKKFDGDAYTCDVCGRDFEYRYGVYHCNKCFAQGGKQFDACPSCGGRAGGGYGGGGGGKKKNNKGKKR